MDLDLLLQRLIEGRKIVSQTKNDDWRIRKHNELAARKADKDAQRKICGAKTRKGQPCRCQGLGRGGRCKYHGGMSTGPRTPEGRQRCSEGTKRRWAAWRTRRGGSSS
jgi:hypothetical protein